MVLVVAVLRCVLCGQNWFWSSPLLRSTNLKFLVFCANSHRFSFAWFWSVFISENQRWKGFDFSPCLRITNRKFLRFLHKFLLLGSALRPLRFLCDLCGKLWLRFSSCSFVSSLVKNGFGCGSATLCPLWWKLVLIFLRASVVGFGFWSRYPTEVQKTDAIGPFCPDCANISHPSNSG